MVCLFFFSLFLSPLWRGWLALVLVLAVFFFLRGSFLSFSCPRARLLLLWVRLSPAELLVGLFAGTTLVCESDRVSLAAAPAKEEEEEEEEERGESGECGRVARLTLTLCSGVAESGAAVLSEGLMATSSCMLSRLLVSPMLSRLSSRPPLSTRPSPPQKEEEEESE
jgi:hypothetical protein